ncbi:hypothetical protein PIB30_011450 [Stylosanthes scabra]|uniref:Cystatin domain-containing protein n=1 Tax=Stylosanthes scabra TaxID=79078 RepID=A0ABU6R6M8_9FABA|nr:hypothetical protein [Stylosanthes scabra]
MVGGGGKDKRLRLVVVVMVATIDELCMTTYIFCGVLDKYNADTQGANFVFVELIRANFQLVNGVIYYITFDAIYATANDSAAMPHTLPFKPKCGVVVVINLLYITVIMCQIKRRAESQLK